MITPNKLLGDGRATRRSSKAFDGRLDKYCRHADRCRHMAFLDFIRGSRNPVPEDAPGYLQANVPTSFTEPEDTGVVNGPDFRTDLHLSTLGEFRDEYNRYIARFQALDGKAQATAGIAGIFLASIFAIARISSKSESLFEIAPLFVALAVFLTVIAISIMAMRIKTTVRAPGGSFVRCLLIQLEENIADENELFKARFQFYGEQASKWDSAVESIREASKQKAKYIANAQLLLLLGVVAVALVTATSVFDG